MKFTFALIILFGIFPFLSDDTSEISQLETLNEHITDSITVEELNELIHDQLQSKLSCVGNEKRRMMKCFIGWEVQVNGEPIWSFKKQPKSYPIEGKLIYNDCGDRGHVCNFQIFADKDSVVARESMRREWKPAKQFAKEYCK